MRPLITVLTLAVADLERAMAFYRDGLGWKTDGICGQEFEHGSVVFFRLHGGLTLALWGRDDLAHDTGLSPAGSAPPAFAIANNVAAREEVDAAMEQAKRAGATIVKAPHKTFYGGYAGYFRDLDGHLWEVAWNPDMPPPAKG